MTTQSSLRGWVRRLVTVCIATFAACGALYSGACSDESETGSANPEIADIIYEGGTNDEAVETLLAAQAVEDPAKAASLTSPADGSELAASPTPVFTWETGAQTDARPDPSPPRSRVLAELLGPERDAHAHGTPVNGKAYLVVFSTAASTNLLRVFTTATTYQPDAAAWQKLRDAAAPITVRITTGTFDNNQLAADGGPFLGPATSFTIAP